MAYHVNMNVDVHLFIACRAPAIMPFSCVLVCICEHAMPKHSILCRPSQYFDFNTYVPSFLPSLAIFYFKSFSLPLQGGLLLNTVCNFSCTKKQIGKNISIVIIQYVLKQSSFHILGNRQGCLTVTLELRLNIGCPS